MRTAALESRPVEQGSTVFLVPTTAELCSAGQPRAAVPTREFIPRRGLSASAVSITGAGPEMPPSFLTRQKCTIIRTEATIGIPMQCQMYERSRAFASTIEPPSKPKRTSLYGVIPNILPKGPSWPSNGVARAMFVPTVTAQNPSWSSGEQVAGVNAEQQREHQ